MGVSSLLTSPKKEEQQVPDVSKGAEIWDELEGFLSINNTTKTATSSIIVEEEEEDEDAQLWMNCHDEQRGWDFTSSNWEDESVLFPKDQDRADESCMSIKDINNNVKSEEEEVGSYFGFRDEMSVIEDTKATLNLNLNYEQVLEAWSNRRSFSAHHPCSSSISSSSSNYYGEVPNLEEERTRRETSVLRYKEKRQNRLFSKKIRYQVRKLNADNRPRLKGRFVKRTSDQMLKDGQNISL